MKQQIYAFELCLNVVHNVGHDDRFSKDLLHPKSVSHFSNQFIASTVRFQNIVHASNYLRSSEIWSSLLFFAKPFYKKGISNEKC